MAHLGDRVAAYVDGQLPADETEHADAHLRDCEACRRSVTAQRALKRRMTSLGDIPSPSSSLLSALSDPARLAAAAPPTRVQTLLDHVLLRAVIAASSASAVLAGVAYVAGAPAQPVDTVSPPVDSFVSQFRSGADPVRQSLRAAADTQPEVAIVVAPGRAISGADRDDPEAVRLLRAALGSDVSVDLLANHYDLSVVRPRTGRADVVVSSRGRRVARYVLDDNHALRQVVRYSEPSAPNAVTRMIHNVTRADMAPSSAGFSTSASETRRAPSVGMAEVSDVIDRPTMDNLTSVGWPCHDRLGTELERTSAQWVDLSGEKAIALTYSDGHSTLTVYEQSGALSRESVKGFEQRDVSGKPVWVRVGNPTVATWDSDGIVYTVVTDGSSQRLDEAVTVLPFEWEPTGALDRVRRGLSRLTRWATPVGEPD